MISAKKKTAKNLETSKTGEDDKNSKNRKKGENLGTNLVWILCIWYSIIFQKQSVLVLLDLKNEVNAIHLNFARELSLPIRLTNIGTQKIDGITLDTYKIVIANFLVINKANQVKFFKNIFLVANCNNRTLRVESFQSGSHVTTII